MPALLTEAEVDKALAALPGWACVEGRLQKEIRFKDFNEAFGFMTRVALIAEKMDHHPDWSNSWNIVVIGIVNHSAGGVTQQCIDFALAVQAVYRAAAESTLTPPD